MAEPRGAIAGTFLAGQLKAGEVQYPFDPPELLLTARGLSVIAPPYSSLSFQRPRLTLQAKEVTADSRTTTLVGQPDLILTAKAVAGVLPPSPLLQQPTLTLTARGFSLKLDQTLLTGKPFLILTARRTAGVRPGLTPSAPISVILTPTVPVGAILTPTVPADDSEEWLLQPTTEVPA